ncbi:MAG TPA: family 10 glycosylhydrolase [Thermoanaerobaculia bacterium]
MRAKTLAVLLISFCLLPSAFCLEYRAYWVDTFHTPLGTHEEIDRVIELASQSHANAIFVEVRRRGDSWYLDSKEPLTEVPGVGEPDANGKWTFDPLRYIIARAHAKSIQVHAFVIVGAVWRGDAMPKDPNHVFLQHIWDAEHNRPYSGPQQWATRSLQQRIRYGDDYYLDLGHPEAASYTLNALLHLIHTYDLDGIHLDRVRYPENVGRNVGYNEVSVARFNALHHTTGMPKPKDPAWCQWRRDQVTQFVRRLYLHATAIKPSIIVSAALVAWSSGPGASGGFDETDAYNTVFQDWREWLNEGILDVACPMLYKREHVARERKQFDDWLSFTIKTAHAGGRLAIAGIGAYMNGIEGTLRQGRRSRIAGADGVLMFAVGDTAPWSTLDNSTNTAVKKNPFYSPAPGTATPKRPNEDFVAAVASGRNARGTLQFEPRGSEPIFGVDEPAPQKPQRDTGSIMGYTHNDGETVTIEAASGQRWSTTTDGSGFFGFAKLPPGEYHIGDCAVSVTASRVNRIDLPCSTQ